MSLPETLPVVRSVPCPFCGMAVALGSPPAPGVVEHQPYEGAPHRFRVSRLAGSRGGDEWVAAPIDDDGRGAA